MAESVQQAKFDRLFDIFDITGDGYISQDDFDGLVDRVVSAAHGSPNGRRAQAVRDGGAHFWAAVKEQAETDGAGRISREAFQAAMDAALLQADRFDEIVRPRGASVVCPLRRGRGRQDRPTGVRAAAERDRPAGRRRRRRFRSIDTNDDGYLTVDEFTAVVEGYLTSADPDAPGNGLFGPL